MPRRARTTQPRSLALRDGNGQQPWRTCLQHRPLCVVQREADIRHRAVFSNAGVENTEQIAELQEASTQLAAELDEVLKTIEESRAKIDKYTSERAGQKSAAPPSMSKKK